MKQTRNQFIDIMRGIATPLTASLLGTALMISNYIMTVVLTLLVVKFINSNKALKLVLYGNKE